MNDRPATRVLVAEDNALVREGLVALLSRHGMQVVAQAVDGEKAVSMYREFIPDLVLMDLRMPRMDGLSAIQIIISEFPNARIVVLTNLDGQEERCQRAGARSLVLKDASKETLITALMEAL